VPVPRLRVYKNTPKINLAGDRGLAWLASNGDSRARVGLFEMVLL